MRNPQPMQPVVKDPHGVLRFRENAIVSHIVDHLDDLVVAQETRSGRLDVDKLTWPPEDREQFAQLAGEKPAGQFRENAIVRYIIEHPARMLATHEMHRGRLDLNKLVMMNFPQEDREQFAQLMGYSISGYHELSYVSDESAAEASALAHEIMPGGGGCRDAGCPIHGGPLDGGKRLA